MSTKQRYQLFRKVENMSFDNIKDNIKDMATPCSDVLELNGEEHAALTKMIRWNYDHVELRCLYPWFETDQIRADIASEMAKDRIELQRQLVLAAKRERQRQAKTEKKAAVHTQRKEKNGKVK